MQMSHTTNCRHIQWEPSTMDNNNTTFERKIFSFRLQLDFCVPFVEMANGNGIKSAWNATKILFIICNISFQFGVFFAVSLKKGREKFGVILKLCAPQLDCIHQQRFKTIQAGRTKYVSIHLIQLCHIFWPFLDPFAIQKFGIIKSK